MVWHGVHGVRRGAPLSFRGRRMPELNGQAVRIPRWAILATLLAGSLLAAGLRVGQVLERNTAHLDALDARTCRIETALKIPPWPSCFQAVPVADP